MFDLVLCYQDVSSFGSYLPRCPIFRQGDFYHPYLLILGLKFVYNCDINLNSGKYCVCCSIGAVYRYYESRRQIVNDSKPLRAEAVTANK